MCRQVSVVKGWDFKGVSNCFTGLCSVQKGQLLFVMSSNKSKLQTNETHLGSL